MLLPVLGAALTVMVGNRITVQRIVALAHPRVEFGGRGHPAGDRGPIRPGGHRLGGWAPPVGIALVADRLSASLLLVSTLVEFAVLIYAIAQRIADYGRQMASSTFYPMYLVLSAGVSLAYLSGDLFTLFVAFEIMLTASYVLITRRTTAQRSGPG